LDATGNAVIAWERSDGANQRIEVRRRTPAGGLSAVQILSEAGRDADAPQEAVARNGNAVVVWRLFDGTNQRIQAVRRSPAGALSVVQTLSDAGHDADAPQLSVDRNGNAIVAWRLFDGTNQRIQAGRRSAGGALSPVLTVSDGGQDATDPEVGADPNGNAVVVWMRSDGAHNRVQAGRLQAG